MKTIVFVGERRSPSARRMRVRWEDGRLAAKQLFDAFAVCGYDRANAVFINLFERRGVTQVLHQLASGRPIVAMGRRVQRDLARRGITFTPLVHPAARGAVRKKEVYATEVRRVLTTVGAMA